MSTLTLNNGIFLRDNNLKITSQVDSYSLTQMLKNPEPMDLGPIDMWAMAQKVEMPLYQMSSFGGKNTIMVENLGGEWRWQVPVSQDLPYVVQDLDSTNITKGIDSQKFDILLNRREFGHGDIISYDKYNGAELVIMDDDILPYGEGFRYTVKIMNNDNIKFLDNTFLTTGIRYFRVGSVRSNEYGKRFSEITTQGNFREYYNYVGQADAHVHYHISSRAALMTKGGINADGTVPVTEIWRNFDQNLDPSITSLDTLKTKMGDTYIKNARKNGTLTNAFVTKLEAAHLTKIAKDIETYLMWGKGGRVSQEGADDVRMSVGLWRQLDNAFKYVYNKSNFSMNIFRNQLYNFFAGRVEFEGPDPHRILDVQTGIGGARLFNEAVKLEANSAGMVIQAAQNAGVGAITGTGMNLGFGYAYTEYVIPFIARIRIHVNPAFDNIQTNHIENPIVDGNPLSSYSFIVFDITDNTQDNIFLLKKSWDNELKWFYENFSMDYLGRSKGFQSSDAMRSGFNCYMQQAYPCLWVKDPTKVLKIVMRNPTTGGSL